jgi:hypothetical protein
VKSRSPIVLLASSSSRTMPAAPQSVGVRRGMTRERHGNTRAAGTRSGMVRNGRERPHRAFVADRRNGQTWQRQFASSDARDSYVREQLELGYFAAAWSIVRIPELARA